MFTCSRANATHHVSKSPLRKSSLLMSVICRLKSSQISTLAVESDANEKQERRRRVLADIDLTVGCISIQQSCTLYIFMLFLIYLHEAASAALTLPDAPLCDGSGCSFFNFSPTLLVLPVSRSARSARRHFAGATRPRTSTRESPPSWFRFYSLAARRLR